MRQDWQNNLSDKKNDWSIEDILIDFITVNLKLGVSLRRYSYWFYNNEFIRNLSGGFFPFKVSLPRKSLCPFGWLVYWLDNFVIIYCGEIIKKFDFLIHIKLDCDPTWNSYY